mgnify:CR=1 FL=1
MKQLKDIAIYVSDKIDTKSMNILDYISTDNMLPERGGIIPCATKPKASRVTQYLPGDVLVSNIRPYFKKIWFSNRNGGCSNDVIVFRVLDENKTYPKYLYYLLSQDIFFDYMMSGSNGTKMPRGNKKLIPEFTFNDVDIEKQKRIADILSAYDNLIENNQKQIKLLEEAAMRLYKEWFVNLRFPGHENTKIVDGVPEGWNRITVAEALQMYIGGGWGKESPAGKYVYKGRVIRGTDINNIKNGDFLSVPVRYHSENDMKKRKLQSNDIVFEMSNGNIDNIGRCLFIDELVLSSCGDNTICASFCKLLRPKDLKTAIVLYHEINDMQLSGRMSSLKKNGANGINNFDFDGFLSHEFLLPDNNALTIYLHDIMLKISNIQKQFLVLRSARDKLLPKLMSGEIEV